MVTTHEIIRIGKEAASFTVLIPEISYVPQSTDMNVLKVTFNSERIIELPRKRGSGNAFDFFRQTRCDLVTPLPFCGGVIEGMQCSQRGTNPRPDLLTMTTAVQQSKLANESEPRESRR